MERQCRRRVPPVVFLLLCSSLFTSPAIAETPGNSWTAEGEIELGGRATWGDDQEGKFLEYRDLEEGVVGDFRVHLGDPSDRYYLRSRGENLGYDDQRYSLEGGRYGHFKLKAFYRELPHVFSTRARTLYSLEGGDTLRLPSGVQSRIAVAADPSSQLATELLEARGKDLEFRWLEAGGGVDFQWTDGIRLYGDYRIQDKQGTRARSMAWGTPGGHFAAFPVEIDEKIHEVRTGGEWLLGQSSLSLEYLGSFFENELRRAVVDNPLVAADALDASTQGRQALAPDNSAHSVSLSGSAPIPVAFPARVVGSVVYGIRLQDQRFLPHTLNPAIASPGLALPQGDLDGRVNTLLANFRVNLDPHPDWDVDLRYRLYRYDNESDELLFAEHVVNDDALVASPLRSVANDYAVQKASIDSSYRLTPGLTGHFGYFWEYWHRSDDRQVEDLHEHGPTVKLDYRLSPQTTTHATYSARTRKGSDYETFAYFDQTLADVMEFGEFPKLRNFDQADRDTHRVDVQARTLQGERLELTFSSGLHLADYRNTDFGLTEEWTWNIGGEAYYQLHPRVGVRSFYDFESIRYEQDSRWRPRSFAPPLTAIDLSVNDWSSRTQSRFHTAGIHLDVAVVPQRLDLSLGYEFHYGLEQTTSSGPSGFAPAAPPTTGGDGGNTVNYPEVEEQLQALTAGLALQVSEQISVLAQYRFELFDLDDDFRRQGLGPFLAGSNVNGSGGTTPSTDVYLGNDVRDYQAHILRLVTRIRF